MIGKNNFEVTEVTIEMLIPEVCMLFGGFFGTFSKSLRDFPQPH